MLIHAAQSLLLIVDLQERLAPAIPGAERIVARTRVLLEAAAIAGVPVLVSEQYPKGLGATLPALAPLPQGSSVLDKVSFSCWREPKLRSAIESTRRPQIVLGGMETHICVLQTAVDLRDAGLDVFVVADAVGSRTEESRRLGLERMRDRGIDVVDSEMVVFEWAERAGTDQFRALSRLVK
ncbi:MAG: hydrolase [Geminicoccaceae bacterium]